MDFRIKERIGLFEACALVASVGQLAISLVASCVFSQTIAVRWVKNHHYHLFVGAFATFSAALISACLKPVAAPQEDTVLAAGDEEDKSPQDRQLVVWQCPRESSYPFSNFSLINKCMAWLSPFIFQNPPFDSNPVLQSNEQPFQLTLYSHCFLPKLGVGTPVKMSKPLPLCQWFAKNRLPITQPPIQPGIEIPLPNLMKEVVKSLDTPEKAAKQIEKDFGRSALFLDNLPYKGTTAKALIDHLEEQFNLTPDLAYKTASFLSQACLPEIVTAVGQGSPFGGGSTDNPMDITEYSRRIVQDQNGFTYHVFRSEEGLKVVGNISFNIVENQKVTDKLPVTLFLNPVTDEASYIIEHELCDELTCTLLEEPLEDPLNREKPSTKVDLSQVLANYLEQHKTHLDLQTAINYAKEGQKLYHQIMSGKQINPSLEGARNLIWHFVCAQILEEGCASEEWTWKICDPDGHLTTFFQNVKGCTERISSHFKHSSLKPHKGFNLINSDHSPAAKGHILVVELDPAKYKNKRFLALKPENYDPMHLMHVVEFGVACIRKFIPGADEQQGWKKERLPSVFKPFGGPRICDLDLQDEQVKKLTDLYGYSEKTLQYRDGNEVILMKEAVSNIAYPEKIEQLKGADLSSSLLGSWAFTENKTLESYSHLIPAILQGYKENPTHDQLKEITLEVQGKCIPLNSTQLLTTHLTQNLNIGNDLASKLILLVTSPVILGFFQPESDDKLTIDILEKPHFSIERIGEKLTIKGKGIYTCKASQKEAQTIIRTLDIDPIARKMWSELTQESP